MELLEKQSSIIYENEEYDYDAICHGCSKWLSMLEQKKIKNERWIGYNKLDRYFKVM